MDGSPQNGSEDRYGVGGGRRGSSLALELDNPSGKRKRIASLSDLAYGGPHRHHPGPADADPPKGERGERVAPETPTPTQFLFPKNVTQEQEAYASGFELALREIYSKMGLPATLASSTEQKRLGCNEVGSVNVDIIGTVSDTSSVSTSANVAQEVPRMLFGQTPVGNTRIASCVNSSSNVRLNSNRTSTVKLPEVETLSQSASNVCSIAPDVREDRGVYSLGRFEEHIPNILSSSQPHLVTVDRISQVRMSTGKTTAEHDARNWVPAFSSVGQIPPCGIAVPSNLSLAGPGSLDHSTASNSAEIYAERFGKILPVSSHVQARIPAMFPARSNCGTLPPVHTSPTGFHTYGNQRMPFPPGSTNLRTYSMHPDTGLEIPVNNLWNGASSSVEPVSCGSWMLAKGGGVPVGVVDMNEQEQMKLERKRAKNRVAAQRCQTRKLERIARLEDKAEKLREQNTKLLQTADDLRTHIAQLKKQITSHADKGCRLLLPDVTTSINSIIAHGHNSLSHDHGNNLL